MTCFEISPKAISDLNDGDLRELVGRLCESELAQQGLPISCVTWGGAQEAADGGLDVSVNCSVDLPCPDFVPSKMTGFQVKKHTMGKASCRKEMLDRGLIKPVITNLAEKHGAYVIVSGKDDCSDKMLTDRIQGMKDAFPSSTNFEAFTLDFYGRDRIARWLSCHPGVALWVRQKIGTPLSGWKAFGRWAATPLSVDDEFLSDGHASVYDRNFPDRSPLTLLDGIQRVRDKLRNEGSVVRITGLSGVGKTRFVQALFEQSVGDQPLQYSSAVYADLGENLVPTASELLESFIAQGSSSIILILDNCPHDIHRSLQNKLKSSDHKVRLLTIEYDISDDDKPEDTSVIHLEPASTEVVSRLVLLRYPELGVINAEKIAVFAGGNSRLAIALASRVKPDETLANFSDKDLFYRLFYQRNERNEALLESAEILSLVYSFNVSNAEYNDELSVLAAISSIPRATLRKNQSELLRRQIAQKRGDWRAVLPHALANRLAKRALENLSLSQINQELFKAENARLLKSCAHRLGSLHNCTEAKELAKSWMLPGAPMHDLSSASGAILECFSYLAPVFPDDALAALERARLKQPAFATRENFHYPRIVRLLVQLAYDESLFDRAFLLLLKFAESETADETRNNVVNDIKRLFSLYHSGTKASPYERQRNLKALMLSHNSRYREIAIELINQALHNTAFSLIAPFDFGAHDRDSGWLPAHVEDKTEWYKGFLSIVSETLRDGEYTTSNKLKSVLSKNFSFLWDASGCKAELESIIYQYASGGSSPEIWRSIRGMLYDGSYKLDADSRQRLEAMEIASAPKDLLSEIRTYVLCNTWDYMSYGKLKYEQANKLMHERVTLLAKETLEDLSVIGTLGSSLWEKGFDCLGIFGEQLARNCTNRIELLNSLLTSIKKSELETANPQLLAGFIKGVSFCEPHLLQSIYDKCLEVPELKDGYVFLLCSVPLDSWRIDKLIELARGKKLSAWSFNCLASGRVHEVIPDTKLSELLLLLLYRDDGVSVVMHILDMRFHLDSTDSYIPSDVITATGRIAIIEALRLSNYEEVQLHSFCGENVAQYCLSSSAPRIEVAEIVEQIHYGVENYKLSSFELMEILKPLVKNFADIILDQTISNCGMQYVCARSIFQNRLFGSSDVALNEAPVAKVLAWCSDDQNKVHQVSNVLLAYSHVEDKLSSTSNEEEKHVIVSHHMQALWSVCEDKELMINTMAKNVWPTGWSGSRVDIVKARAKALSVFSENLSEDLRRIVSQKVSEINEAAEHERAKDAELYSLREQRFE